MRIINTPTTLNDTMSVRFQFKSLFFGYNFGNNFYINWEDRFKKSRKHISEFEFVKLIKRKR